MVDAVLAPSFLRQSFDAQMFWCQDVSAPKRFGADVFELRFKRWSGFAPIRFGARIFYVCS